jgi:hypothetical protein
MSQDPKLCPTPGDGFARPNDGLDEPAVPEPLAQIYCIATAS